MYKYGILTAMKEEAELIIDKYNLKFREKYASLEIYESEEIILVLSWIWKVKSTLWTTLLVEKFKSEKYINIWIVWSLNLEKHRIGQVFLPSKFIQHDMKMPFDWEHLDDIKKPIFIEWDWTICLTWDEFVSWEDRVNFLKKEFSWDICDMEAFCFLSVLRDFWEINKALVIKSISDWAEDLEKNEHMSNLDYAMQKWVEKLGDFIN